MIESLTSWLITQFPTVFDWLKDTLVWFVNQLIEALGATLTTLFSVLPEFTLPTLTQLSNSNQMLTAINYFIPLDCLISCLAVWSASEVAHITLAPVMRWFRVFR